MPQLFTNNARSTLAVSISNSSNSATLAAGTGSQFPNPGAGDFFLLTLFTDTSGIESDVEIVMVTARSGDAITITRAQEGTAAVAHGAGSVAALRTTAGWAQGMSAALATAEQKANKNAASGYLGLDASLRAILVNGAINSLLANAASAPRTWTLPDKSGTVAMTSDITGLNSGTNTGDQTITLTGDVTGSGTGSFGATIAANVVTLGKLQQVATETLLGRVSAATGNVETLSAGQARTLLSLDQVNNTSDTNKPISTAQQTALDAKQSTAEKNAASGYPGLNASHQVLVKNAAGSITSLLGSAATTARTYTLPDKTGTVAMTSDITGMNSGTNTGDQTIALTGDVTGSGTGSFAATIAANAVTFAKMQQVGTATILGRSTAGTGNVESLTASAARALLSLDQVTNTSDAAKPVSTAQAAALALKQDLSGKMAANGYPGLNASYRLRLLNSAGANESLLMHDNTAARLYSLRDRSGTLCDDTDLGLKADKTNGTLTNPTIVNYIEKDADLGTGNAFTINLANGTVQYLTTNANTTITLPAPIAGKGYTLWVFYGGAHTVNFIGGGTLRPAGGTAPSSTSVAGKFDIFVFSCSGTITAMRSGGSNF